ncbi:MAG: hypothetical protein ACP5I3_11865 [Thermoproteus sp.]
MKRLIILLVVIAVIAAAVYVATHRGPAPQKGIALSAVYNATTHVLTINSNVPVYVVEDRANATTHNIPADNGTCAHLLVLGRTYSICVDYAVSYTYFHYSGGSAQWTATVYNRGNATLALLGRLIPPGQFAAVSGASLPQSPLVSVTAEASAGACYPDHCDAALRLYANGVPGSLDVKISTPSGSLTYTLTVGQPLTVQLSVPYGSSIYVQTPWGVSALRIAPPMEVRLTNLTLLCSQGVCRHYVTVGLNSSVPGAVEVRPIGQRFGIAVGWNTLTWQALFGRQCYNVVPPGAPVCVDAPYVPPAAVLVGVQWYWSVQPGAVVTLYNPGYDPYNGPVYCPSCVHPPPTFYSLVSAPVNPGSVNIPARQAAVYAFYGPNVTLVLPNGTVLVLRPPPAPKISVVRVEYVDRSSQAYFNGTNGVMVYRTYTITFASPYVDYAALLYASSAGSLYQLSCTSNVCVAKDVPYAFRAGNATLYFRPVLVPINYTLP